MSIAAISVVAQGGQIVPVYKPPVVDNIEPPSTGTSLGVGQIFVKPNSEDAYINVSQASGVPHFKKFSFEGEEFVPPLIIGTSTDRVTETEGAFSSDGNVLQVYASTAGGTAGTTYRAIRGDLSVSTGNASESPQAVRGALTIATGASVEEGYGGYFNATQNDGTTNVDSNLIGVLGIVSISEATPADQPQQWIFGGQSVVSFGASAGVPTASIVAAHASYVTYDAPMNAIAHGYVASRNGGGAGGTAGSAYKVLIGGGIDDWQYGLDLYTGDIANNYSVADIRLANQSLIDGTSGTGVTFSNSVTATLGDITATLGDLVATNGNLVLGTAGNKLEIAEGANSSVGQVTLAGGTATVNTTAVTANSRIFISRSSIGATGAAALGLLTVGTITPGTSFVIDAVQAADATALQASDVSVIDWFIIN